MNRLKYITNEKGQPMEVILPLKTYRELVELKNTYEEKLRILRSIKAGAEEIIQDRINHSLNRELSEFIDELEDNTN